MGDGNMGGAEIRAAGAGPRPEEEGSLKVAVPVRCLTEVH